MADDIHQIHDKLVHRVLVNPESVTDLLRRHLPEPVSQRLRWNTLKQLDRSFVDEEMRGTEADFLYEVEHGSDDDTVWLYVLVEHQSAPDKWLRFRLLRYCCRIWEMNRDQKPEPSELRPIVPLVFYQGRDRWTYATEFADLFAESVRDWPGVPRFSHELVDQSGMQPQEIEGELKVRLMQLVMLAAYHPDRPWRDLVVELIGMLSSLSPSGGINYVRVFLLYILQTQEIEEIEMFREGLRRHAPQAGDDLMTYGQQLIEQGKIQERVTIIENLLELGDDWSRIEAITGVNEVQFQALKQQLEEMTE
jgi:predicted transposase/invertase (TIGR01784 family)